MSFGMDPKVAEYFKKILNSIFAGLMWMFVNITAGIYFGLAFREHFSLFINILFYLWLAISLGLLLWYLYKVWGNYHYKD